VKFDNPASHFTPLTSSYQDFKIKNIKNFYLQAVYLVQYHLMKLTVHTDGGSRGNPGPAAAAFIITDSAGALIKQSGSYLGVTTNNRAEYQAVLLALTWISQNFKTCISALSFERAEDGISEIIDEEPDKTLVSSLTGRRRGSERGFLAERIEEIPSRLAIAFYLDSELVARQLSGQYKIKSKELLPLAVEIRSIISQLAAPVRFFPVPRGQNRAADQLVNQTLDSQIS